MPTIAVNVSLAAFPGLRAYEAMERIQVLPPSEPALPVLGCDHTQICPQNRGQITEDAAAQLREAFPATRFRLHANARVQEKAKLIDWSGWHLDSGYWRALARISKALNAPGYSAHAGYRTQSDLAFIVRAAQEAEDLFDCPVAIEGHYPVRGNPYLISSWEEYRALFESGARYALDLSHLHIVASVSGLQELTLVQEMLACERCLEIHLSSNDGSRDQHQQLADTPWWWSALQFAHPDAVIFSEGVQPRFVVRDVADGVAADLQSQNLMNKV